MESYQQLEKDFAAWAGVSDIVSCNSGTAALHLALEALRLPLGSEVIVPNFTMIACARAVTLAGLVPVLVDCKDDLLIDPDLVDEACSRAGPGRQRGGNITAIMPVHVYGRRCDMDALSLLADKYDLFVIEDLAEAHGIAPHPNSDAACWSFYKNKIIAGEEGGAIWLRYPEAASLARQLRCQGFTEAHDFTHIPRGHNYRMANCLAKCVLGGLELAETYLRARRQIEGWYDAACPNEWKMPPRDVPWVYDVRIGGMGAAQQSRVVDELKSAGIGARRGFYPMCDQLEYKGCRMVAHDLINGTRSRLASHEVIYLPIQPGVTTEADVDKAFQTIHRVLGR